MIEPALEMAIVTLKKRAIELRRNEKKIRNCCRTPEMIEAMNQVADVYASAAKEFEMKLEMLRGSHP